MAGMNEGKFSLILTSKGTHKIGYKKTAKEFRRTVLTALDSPLATAGESITADTIITTNKKGR